MYQKIDNLITELNVTLISEDRKQILQPLVDFIQEKTDASKEVNLNFICTHNSRRSHLTQIWAQTMASYCGVKNVKTYSGGTEATAMFVKVVETLRNTGFEIQKLSECVNPVYAIKYDDNSHPIVGFSKKHEDAFNPTSGFVAIMTCSQADKGCPFIMGAEKRVSITYQDPKIFDGKENQAEKYQERSVQIATEMLYVFLQINK